MTPKEKAEELLIKMYKSLPSSIGIDRSKIYSSYNQFNTAKQCALVAVDEIINNAFFIWGGVDNQTGLTARDMYRKYWQEVKQEIEKL